MWPLRILYPVTSGSDSETSQKRGVPEPGEDCLVPTSHRDSSHATTAAPRESHWQERRGKACALCPLQSMGARVHFHSTACSAACTHMAWPGHSIIHLGRDSVSARVRAPVHARVHILRNTPVQTAIFDTFF